jgi:hypothetical protein
LTTTDKDFKVKKGLQVSEGGTFGGPVAVGSPTQASHAVTKEYLDTLISALPGSNLDGGDVDGATYTDGGTPTTESWDATIDAGNIE